MTAGNVFSEHAAVENAGGIQRLLPLAFVLVTVVTIACVAFAWLHGPVLQRPVLHDTRTTAIQPDPTFNESMAEEIQTASLLPGSAPAQQPRAANSPWEIARADALRVQRRIEEMLPATPGVTPDQYIDGSDDLPPVVDEDQDEYLPRED